jgi:hypothetical protein
MLTKGRVHYFGDVPGGVRAYESANDEGGDREDAFLSTSEPITDFRVDSMLKCVSSGKDLTLELQINASAPIAAYTIRVIFYNASGGFAADGNLDVRGPECALESGINSMRCAIPVVPLKQGKYALAINLIDPHGDLIVWSYKQHKILVTDSHASAMSDCQLSITLARI